MSAVKERIIGAVTVMNEEDAKQFWEIILHEFSSKNNWDDIEEVDPDEWDIEMLADIESDPDCKSFISEKELLDNLNF